MQKPSSRGSLVSFLEFGAAGGAGEGQHVADVGNARQVHDEALEAQAETGVGGGAELAALIKGDSAFVAGYWKVLSQRW